METLKAFLKESLLMLTLSTLHQPVKNDSLQEFSERIQKVNGPNEANTFLNMSGYCRITAFSATFGIPSGL